jgi:hypothetical protein
MGHFMLEDLHRIRPRHSADKPTAEREFPGGAVPGTKCGTGITKDEKGRWHIESILKTDGLIFLPNLAQPGLLQITGPTCGFNSL